MAPLASQHLFSNTTSNPPTPQIPLPTSSNSLGAYIALAGTAWFGLPATYVMNSKLRAEVKSTEEGAKHHKDDMDRLEKKVKALEDKEGKVTQDVETASALFATKAEHFGDAITDLASELDEIKTSVKGIRKFSLKRIFKSGQKLEGKVDLLAVDLAAVKADITSMKQDIADLKATSDRHEATFRRLEASMDAKGAPPAPPAPAVPAAAP